MKQIFYLSFFLFSLFLHAEEELVISLTKQKKLQSIYLQFQWEKNDAIAKYQKEMEKIISFDWNQTAHTSVLSQKIESLDSSFERSFWKSSGISYVIDIIPKQNSLIFRILNVKLGTVKSYPKISLTGKTPVDRQTIHKYISKVQQDLFGRKGIQDQKILFSLRKKNNSADELKYVSEIWISDYDGANAKQLTFHENYSTTPKFFPENKSFLYVSFIDGQSKIFATNFQTHETTQLIPLRGSQILPSVSANSKYISFISDAAGRPDLFLQMINENGYLETPRQLFSFPRATQASSTFSPDGQKIAFVSDKDGPPTIYIIDIPKEKRSKRPLANQITKKNRQNTSPSWSPDGSKLAFSAKISGVRQIWIYDFETNEEWQLTTSTNNMENPSWASDSLHLLFNSENEYTSELYLMHIYQNYPIKITDGVGDKKFPSWEH